MSTRKNKRFLRDRNPSRAKRPFPVLVSRAPLLSTTSPPGSATPLTPPVNLVRAADVPLKAVPYFWAPAIAFGKVAVILASTATCTSALIAELAAKASGSGDLPQSQGPVPISDIGIVAAEAGIAERIRPQVDAAGADLSRVHFFSSAGGKTIGMNRFDPMADCKPLSAAIRAAGNIKVVLVEFAIPRIDADLPRNYKGFISVFSTIARDLDVAVVVLFHPAGDPPGRKELAQAANAVALFHAVGAVGIATREPNSGRWLLAWIKNVVGHDAPGLTFRIEAKVTSSGGPAAGIAWDPEPVAATETLKLMALGGGSNAEPSKLKRAKEFLAEQVKTGLVDAAEVDALAAAAGIGKSTLTKARKALGIEFGKKDALIKLGAVKRATVFLQAELANGSVSVKAIRRRAKEEGISKASLRRAYEALKIESKRKGGAAGKGHWVWRLPDQH
jgi:putative DNA primase/helicase